MTGTRSGPGWPEELIWVRHGESDGNVEALRASRAGVTRLDLAQRDADTPLSQVGTDQARAVGQWWRAMAPAERPEVVLASPYLRARRTAELAVASSGLGLEVDHDDRLRERDLGCFDELTGAGIRELYPAEADRRARTGKLYYRPPGGESWCDVALRVRSLLGDLREHHAGRRVAVVSHQAVIMCARMVIEHLDEQRVLELDRDEPMANCSLTTYRLGPGSAPVLVSANDTTPVESQDEPVTKEPAVDDRH